MELDKSGKFIKSKTIYGELGGAFCKKCNQWKEIIYFVKCNQLPQKTNYICKNCHNEANKIRKKETNKKLTKLDKHIKYIKTEYGLSEKDYLALLIIQDYKCKICGVKEEEGKRLCIDHCHITNKIRGLLCRQCNSAIGSLKDNKDIIINAYHYIQHNGISSNYNYELEVIQQFLLPNEMLDR